MLVFGIAAGRTTLHSAPHQPICGTQLDSPRLDSPHIELKTRLTEVGDFPEPGVRDEEVELARRPVCFDLQHVHGDVVPWVAAKRGDLGALDVDCEWARQGMLSVDHHT